MTACGGDGGPSARPTIPENVVAEASEALTRVVVAAGGRTVELTVEQRAQAAPLLTARILQRPVGLEEYGLDRPVATLTYERRSGPPVIVVVGGTTFDARGVYVVREGDPRVFTVLAEQVGPLLALVGVELPPPT